MRNLELSNEFKTALEGCRGLRPTTWICVGQNLGREDIKELLLSEEQALSAQAVIDLETLCLSLLPKSALEIRSISKTERMRLIEFILSKPQILKFLPLIQAKKSSSRVVAEIERALKMGRMAFAHEEECEAMLGFLEARGKSIPMAHELKILTTAFEAILDAKKFYDLPLLLARATRALEEGWPHSLKPQKIIHVYAGTLESREKFFWSAISREVEVIDWNMLEQATRTPQTSTSVVFRQSHALEDGIAFVLDEILAERRAHPERALKDFTIYVPDQENVRQSIVRQAKERRVPLFDVRDPARYKLSEDVKRALLPLECVATDFSVATVTSYLKLLEGSWSKEELRSTRLALAENGVQKGLYSYKTGKLRKLGEELTRLKKEFEPSSLVSRHLEWVKKTSFLDETRVVIEKAWGAIETFETLIDEAAWFRRRRLFQRLRWLKEAIQELTPEASALKVGDGIRVTRLGQVSLMERLALNVPPKSWIVGLTADAILSQDHGDWFFSAEDRMNLSLEFSVASAKQRNQDFLKWLKWLADTREKVEIVENAFDSGGAETESTELLLRAQMEGLFAGAVSFSSEPALQAHPKYMDSYFREAPLNPRAVTLVAKSGELFSKWDASLMDRASRCTFQALGSHRWKLYDAREASIEGWPDARGRILHKAIEIWFTDEDSRWTESLATSQPAKLREILHAVIEKALLVERPKGHLLSPRLEVQMKESFVEILVMFLRQDFKYREKARAKPLMLEGVRFQEAGRPLREVLEYKIGEGHHALVLKCVPDRVDQTPQGLMILDYKMSADLPHGDQMHDLGYRMQLPLYALALEQKLGEKVAGLMFVELSKKGGRSRGIYFSEYNGKAVDSIYQLRSNSRSLMVLPREKVIEKLESNLASLVHALQSGVFTPKPLLENECEKCSLSSACGRHRNPLS